MSSPQQCSRHVSAIHSNRGHPRMHAVADEPKACEIKVPVAHGCGPLSMRLTLTCGQQMRRRTLTHMQFLLRPGSASSACRPPSCTVSAAAQVKT